MSGSRPLRAVLLPSYRWNPYLRLLAGALEGAGVEATVLHAWSRRAPILGAWWTAGRPGVVHLHWVHDFLGGSEGSPTRRNVHWFDWQLRLLRSRGVRVVWTVHNLKGHEAVSAAGGAPGSPGGDARDAGGDARDADAHRRLIERADAIILHCDMARHALIELYRPSPAARARMHVLPHGSYVDHYEVDADAGAARRRLRLPEAGTTFVFVGAIRGYKNVGELLDAFAGLDELGPHDRLLICGKPLPRKLGRELQERSASDPRILLRLERLPEDELSSTLRAADVVVLPFRDILTSGSAILALSHGRPVIAPALGCLPQTLPADATILYDPAAPTALRDAMRDALAADLRAMGQRARAWADTLAWGPIGAATARLYRGETSEG